MDRDQYVEESFHPEPPVGLMGGAFLVFLLSLIIFFGSIGVLVWNLWKWSN